MTKHMKKREEAVWQKVLLAVGMSVLSVPAVGVAAYIL